MNAEHPRHDCPMILDDMSDDIVMSADERDALKDLWFDNPWFTTFRVGYVHGPKNPYPSE